MQSRLRVDREGRIPPAIAVGLIALVMVIGALAYSAGRFGRRGPARVSPAELPAPAAPVPALAEAVPTPADLPPTVTPSAPVLIEKLPPGPVPTARPTPFPAIPPEESTPRRRIMVEIQATPPPSPTPTVPELEQGEENEEPPPEETPGAPEPTPPAQPRGSPASI